MIPHTRTYYRYLLSLLSALALTEVVHGSSDGSEEHNHAAVTQGLSGTFLPAAKSQSFELQRDIFLSPEEFEEKMAPFNNIFKTTSHLPLQPVEAVVKWQTLGEGSSVTIMPVPERCAMIHPIQQGKLVRLETAGLCACVGIAGWNSKNIGLIHWDNAPDKQCLQKFLETMTLGGKLNEETTFLLSTNYLSSRLLVAHEMIERVVPKAPILLEVEHSLGGYVVADDQHRDFYLKEDKDKHFLPGTDERRAFPLKSLSISTNAELGSFPYSFSATEPADRLQDYFEYLDAPNHEGGEYQRPKAYWQSNFSDMMNDEPDQLWIVADKLYSAFVKLYEEHGPFANFSDSSKQSLIYLHDEY